MLKQRLITAAILVPLVVWGILGLPTSYLSLVLALFIVQGAWEWTGFMQLKVVWQRILYVAVVALGLACIWFFQQDSFLAGANTDWLALPILSLFWWLLATVWVLSYPRTVQRWSSRAVLVLIGLLVLLPTWLAVVGLHASGEQGVRCW